MSPLILEMLAKASMEERLREIRQLQLAEMARKCSPSYRERITVRLGEQLKSIGEKLIMRYNPSVICGACKADSVVK